MLPLHNSVQQIKLEKKYHGKEYKYRPEPTLDHRQPFRRWTGKRRAESQVNL